MGVDIHDIFSGLIGAVILGTVLTATVLLIVHLTVAERPERWVLRGFAWLATACTLGVAGGAVFISVVAAITGISDGVVYTLVRIFPRMLALTFWFAEAATLFFAIPYLPLLLLWARIGGKFGWMENTTRGVCASAALLAVPAVLVTQIAQNSRVFDPTSTIRDFTSLALDFILITICLALPRIVIPMLRHGAFSEAK